MYGSHIALRARRASAVERPSIHELAPLVEQVCQRRRKNGPWGGVKIGHSVLGACPRSPREGPARGAACLSLADAAAARGRALWTHVGKRRAVAGSAVASFCVPAALVEPVALAVHLEDVDMVGEPVEQRAGEAFGAEHLGPFVERQVGGDHDRAALVALAEDLEQQLGAGLGERHEAELVDDQQPVLGQLLLEPQQALLVPRLHQFVHQGGGGGEADGQPLLAGRQTEPEGDVGLAGAGVAERDDVLAALDVLTAGQFQDQHLVERGMALKSKLSRLLTAGNLACLIRRSTMRRSRSISSSSARRSR